MSSVVIDEDVYAGVTPHASQDAAAEAEQIQQALMSGGDNPIDLQATAAGGDGGAGGGHPLFVLGANGAEVLPDSGAGTIGVSYGTSPTLQGVIPEPAAPAPEPPPVVEPPPSVNHPPTLMPDNARVVEGEGQGHLLTVDKAHGVLANDVPGSSGVLTVTVAEIDSLLGGHLSLHADGSYTYKIPAQVHNVGGADKPDVFHFDVTDSNGVVYHSTLTIDIRDTAPTAIDDSNLTNSDHLAVGNVVTGEGQTGTGANHGADLLNVDTPFTLSVVHGSDHGAVTGITAHQVETINGDYGTLTIDIDGGTVGNYTYHASTAVSEVVQDVLHNSTGPVTAYGFEKFTSILDTAGNLIIPADAQAGQHLDVKEGGDKAGIGVKAALGSNAVDHGEAILFDLHQNVNDVTVTIAQYNAHQKGDATWHAYDANGLEVAHGNFDAVIDDGKTQTLDIHSGTAFQRIVLTESGTSEGFVVQGVELHNVSVSDHFQYTLTDSDGSHSSAELTIGTSHDLMVSLLHDPNTTTPS